MQYNKTSKIFNFFYFNFTNFNVSFDTINNVFCTHWLSYRLKLEFIFWNIMKVGLSLSLNNDLYERTIFPTTGHSIEEIVEETAAIIQPSNQEKKTSSAPHLPFRATHANKCIFKEFSEELEKLRQSFAIDMDFVFRVKEKQRIFDQIFSIFYKNYNLFLPFLGFFLKKDQFEIVKLFSEENKEILKDAKLLFSASYIEIHYRNKYQKKIYKFSKKYECLDKDLIQNLFKELSADFEKEKDENSKKIKEINKKWGWKWVKVATCRFFPPLFYIAISSFLSEVVIEKLEKKTIAKTINFFFKFVNNYRKFIKFEKENQKKRNWVNFQQLPGMNPVFSEEFIEWVKEKFTKKSSQKQFFSFQNSKLNKKLPLLIEQYENETHLKAKKDPIENQKNYFDSQVREKTIVLTRLIQESAHQDFNQFKTVLGKSGFYLKEFEVVHASSLDSSLLKEGTEKTSINISNMKTWEQWQDIFGTKENLETSNLFNDNVHLLEFVKQSVNKQIEKKVILEKSFHVALSKKIEIEKSFLNFDLVKNIADFLLNISQFVILFPKASIHLTKWGVSQISKPFVHSLENKALAYFSIFFYLLDPQVNLSIYGLLEIIVTQIFGYYYKPKEFGRKGICFSIKLRYYRISMVVNSILKLPGLICKGIDNSLLKNSSFSFNKAIKYFKLKKLHKRNYNICLTKIRYFEEQIQQLKKSDYNKSINPYYKKKLEKTRKEVELLNKEENSPDLQNKEKLDVFFKNSNLRLYLIEHNCPKQILDQVDKQIEDNEFDDQLNSQIDTFLESKHLYTRQAVVSGKAKLKYCNNSFELLENLMNECDQESLLNPILKFLSQNNSDHPSKKISLDYLFTADHSTLFKFLERARLHTKSICSH